MYTLSKICLYFYVKTKRLELSVISATKNSHHKTVSSAHNLMFVDLYSFKKCTKNVCECC